MKKLLGISLFCLVSIQVFGTAQLPDILIYKGDTLSLFDCPLEYFPDLTMLSTLRLFGSDGCFSTACYRKYVARWEIKDNKLYLLSIRNACYPTGVSYVKVSLNEGNANPGTEYADLKAIFPERYKDGRVFADWVNAKLISPNGKLLYYIHDGFESIFEKELEFAVENGMLKQIREFDNSKTRISKYTSNPDLLKEFVKSNINYSNVARPENPVKVYVLITGANDEGRIDSVRVIKGFNQSYDQEAERVIKSIPEWDVLYRHGEKIAGPVWIVPVIFEPATLTPCLFSTLFNPLQLPSTFYTSPRNLCTPFIHC